jgi:hypothetical protein
MSQLEFVRQVTPFSCGPACVQSLLACVRREGICQDLLIKELSARPNLGTDHETLARWCASYLPIASVGEDTYRQGVAIANIRNPLWGNGHYVVLLHHDERLTRYYCPLVRRILILPTRELDWRNGSGTMSRWSINFALPSLHAKPIRS